MVVPDCLSVIVRMNVDKAWCYDFSAGVDLFRGGAMAFADGGDLATSYRNVGLSRFGTGAVDDMAATNGQGHSWFAGMLALSHPLKSYGVETNQLLAAPYGAKMFSAIGRLKISTYAIVGWPRHRAVWARGLLAEHIPPGHLGREPQFRARLRDVHHRSL